MTKDAKPSIFPVLRYKEARAAIDWLIRAFGFEMQAEHVGPGGTIAHAELRFRSGVIGVSSMTAATAGNPWSAVRQGIYVCVDDPDTHHDRARAAGADIVMPLRDMDYGSREYAARDLEGYLWGFGTYDMGATRGDASIFPELRYRDISAALAWLPKAFGFETTLKVPGPNETIVHAEMRFGGGVIMVGAAPDESDEGDEWSDLKQFLNVHVDDPDTHFARAKATGATIVKEPQNTPYGARFYAARDLEGFLWWFSTYRPAPR